MSDHGNLIMYNKNEVKRLIEAELSFRRIRRDVCLTECIVDL